jgi:uncharacterized membrane protein YccC
MTEPAERNNVPVVIFFVICCLAIALCPMSFKTNRQAGAYCFRGYTAIFMYFMGQGVPVAQILNI